MSDLKLFRFSTDQAEELAGRSALVERDLHDLMEKHMECFLGIRLIAHEYSTGKNHRGRIDSLGLDENCCPVIIEYKRHQNENVINQGLYYLDWLLDHKAEFQLLVMNRFDKETAEALEWGGTRVLCVAGDFTKFDEHAVAQIGRNIELIRYKYFADNLLMLEWLNPIQMDAAKNQAPSSSLKTSAKEESSASESNEKTQPPRSLAKLMAAMPAELVSLYDDLKSFIMSLGDDINAKELLHYIAFTRLKNFVCLLPMKSGLKLTLKLNPDSVTLEENFSRDLRGLGHLGTGDLEISIRSQADLAKAKALIERAYQEN